MITLDDLLTSGGRHPEAPERSPPTPEMLADGAVLVERVNALQLAYGMSLEVSCGYRDPQLNRETKGAAPKSHHMFLRAVDFRDPRARFDAWCLAHQSVLEEKGLWLEHPLDTPGWSHLQIVPPRSGRRVFRK